MTKKTRKHRTEYIVHKREPEVSIGEGVMLVDHRSTDPREQAAMAVLDLKKGDRVHIARGIITAAGPRYRVLNTICWLNPDQVWVDNACEQNAARHVDPNDESRAWLKVSKSATTENRFTPSPNGDSLKNMMSAPNKPVSKQGWVAEYRESQGQRVVVASLVKSSPRTPKKSTRTITNPTGKTNYMDKQTLRTLISALKSGQKISINFIGDKAHLSRDWTVVRTKQGRGKGGSKLVELVDSAKNLLTTGTPDSDKILNITVDGTLHGYTSEADIPVAFETNVTQAATLKESFKQLLTAEGDKKVKVASTIADLTGTFTVNKATQLRGRGGQIRLELENTKTGRKVEMWSRRHSGVITDFTILGE